MFAKKWAKSPANITFTIHALRLPEPTQDAFQIEWKRGDSNGQTEKAFPMKGNGQSGEVSFEKVFRCKATVFIDKSDGALRPKLINFTVRRYMDGSKKVFGKFQVDASLFYGKSTQQMMTFEIESPNSKKSYAVISVSTVPIDTQNAGRANSSSGETNAETSIYQSEGLDLSESVNNADREKINKFFSCKSEKGAQSLSTFSTYHGRLHNRVASAESFSLSSDASSPLHSDDNSSRFNSFFGSKKCPVPLNIAPPSIISSNDDALGSSIGEAINFLRSVLSKNWCQSPVIPGMPCEALSSLYAAILNSGILTSFSDSEFEEITRDFECNYRQNQMISNATELDQLIVSMSILSTLMKDGSERSQRLSSAFSTICVEQMSVFVNNSSFAGIARKYIFEECNEQEALLLFGAALSKIGLGVVKGVDDFFTSEIVNSFDCSLVQSVLESTGKCTFSNSIQWKGFISDFSAKYGKDLLLFSETANTLQMGNAISFNPSLADSVCPDLSHRIIYEIIKMQLPDDLAPAQNETEIFTDFFKEQMKAEDDRMTYKLKGDIKSAASSIPADLWKGAKFKEEIVVSYPFLKRCFE